MGGRTPRRSLRPSSPALSSRSGSTKHPLSFLSTTISTRGAVAGAECPRTACKRSRGFKYHVFFYTFVVLTTACPRWRLAEIGASRYHVFLHFGDSDHSGALSSSERDPSRILPERETGASSLTCRGDFLRH